MAYRDDVDALSARHDALAAEVASKTRELDAAAQLLTEAKARASLPVLDNIRVATPCTADWAKMTGDDRVRMCGACNKHVFNLSEMTREDAERLIVAKEGRLCVRYFRRADGTILTKDCTVGIQQKRRRRIIGAAAAALLAGGGAALAMKLLRPSCAVEQVKMDPTLGVEPLSIEVHLPPAAPEPVHELQGEMLMGDVLSD